MHQNPSTIYHLRPTESYFSSSGTSTNGIQVTQRAISKEFNFLLLGEAQTDGVMRLIECQFAGEGSASMNPTRRSY